MEGHELLGKVNRVKAPSDFEEWVFAKLGEERRARVRRRAVFRYAFAGSAAVFLIGFVLLSERAVVRRPVLATSDQPRSGAAVQKASFPLAAREGAPKAVLPVLEAVDYSSEFRNASYQPQTVYILEQVSEVRPSEIKY